MTTGERLTKADLVARLRALGHEVDARTARAELERLLVESLAEVVNEADPQDPLAAAVIERAVVPAPPPVRGIGVPGWISHETGTPTPDPTVIPAEVPLDDLPPTEAAAAAVERYAAEPAQVFPAQDRWAQMVAMADALSKASIVKPAFRGKPADLLVALIYAHDLGLPTSVALAKVHVIEGVPALDASVQAALVRRAGGRIDTAPGTDGGVVRNHAGWPIEVRVVGVRPDGATMEVGYTTLEAEAAGRCTLNADGTVRARSNSGKPLPWETSTVDMLWARAVTRLIRRLFPDVVHGAIYDPDELDATATPVTNVAQPEPEPLPQDERDEIRAAISAHPEIERIKAAWKTWRLPALDKLTEAHRPRVEEFLRAHRLDREPAAEAEIVEPLPPVGACEDCGMLDGAHADGCPADVF